MQIKINSALPWKNGKTSKPDSQDVPCVVALLDVATGSVYPVYDLYFWNGAAWWPCDGDYTNYLSDDDVVFYLPVMAYQK